MNFAKKSQWFLFIISDFVCFFVALWLSLFLRNLEVPDLYFFLEHVKPFSFLFIFWSLNFFIAGLYEKKSFLIKGQLANILLKTQIINSVIAIVFFYFTPFFNIAPKTLLFFNLVLTFVLVFFWRNILQNFVFTKKIQEAVIVGNSAEVMEIIKEVNNNPRYGLYIKKIETDSLDTESLDNVKIFIADFKSKDFEKINSDLYKLIFKKVFFISTHEMYEKIFDRISPDLLGHDWFLLNTSISERPYYDFIKRFLDIFCAIFFGLISLVFYPFVWLAIKIEDGGPIFIIQERVGENGKKINLIKFRTMKNRKTDEGFWLESNDQRITKIGSFLRKSRIDELPQLWNIFKGDMSLIGPRPDLVNLAQKLSEEIPYHNIRTSIKPGLSGWAQTKQELPPQSVEESKIRLSYDIYYIKNRSIFLDIKIILQTIRTLLSRTGL